ncbi:hypothetical protein LTR56_016478 [Elasticomyces elasticus]|nr:hypothetical protein LTR56_016478 [Elasticomyces elasticus]KAK3633484.1 hypothetical protein LTR22_020104 [Elasticomyces elasticus]
MWCKGRESLGKLTPQQREKAMRETVGDEKVLKNSQDPGARDVDPDWNLKDITSIRQSFLDRFKLRVETDLHKQQLEGVNGGAEDRDIIRAAAQRQAPNRAATLIYYNSLMEEMLDLGSESRARNTVHRKATKDTVDAMTKLTVVPKPSKISISDVIAQADEQRVASEDYLDLLRSEPVVLNRAVNMLNASRPELVPGDHGRILPLLADRYLRIAFLEVMSNAVKIVSKKKFISPGVHPC